MPKVLCALAALGLWVGSSLACYAEGMTGTAAITAVQITGEAIHLYVDALDQDGMPLKTEPDSAAAFLGDRSLPVLGTEAFGASGEAAAYTFLVDISVSVNPGQNKGLKEPLLALAEQMKPDDQVSIVAFGSEVTVLQDFTKDKEAVRGSIAGITAKDNSTNLYKGVVKALDLLSGKRDGLPAKRILVILSDGEEWHDKGITREEVYMKIRETGIPVYTVSFHNAKASAQSKEYMKVLGSFARASSGQEYVLGQEGATADTIVRSIHARVDGGLIVRLDRKGIKGEGQSAYLKLALTTQQGTVLESGKDIRMDVPEASPKASPEAPPAAGEQLPADAGPEARADEAAEELSVPSHKRWLDAWLWWTAGVAAALVVFTVMRRRKRRAGAEPDAPMVQAEAGMGEAVEYISDDCGRTQAMGIDFQENKQRSPGGGVLVRLTQLGRHEAEQPVSVRLSDCLVIGRDRSKAEIIFGDDDRLSGRHCELLLRSGHVYVSDLQSTNGTYINGVRIEGSYLLQHDDVLLIGSMELRVGLEN
ncbi:MAG: hypothetical protein K0R57_4959 [Paenibacillaceae bacterium]|jgi:hypothetical protein|nr:hypothetical protein [Paenibacillaceae bacterium]